MKKLVLIDGHSILNRAYYGVPDYLRGKAMSYLPYKMANVINKFDKCYEK